MASAKDELDERAKHFVTAKLTWRLSEATRATLDYEYQDDQVAETVEEIEQDVYKVNRTAIDAFDLLGISVKHRLFEKWQGIRFDE
ncbi:MAG: hypothetical protein ACQERN_12250 [Thermodesulfobacteriota bacterium]